MNTHSARQIHGGAKRYPFDSLGEHGRHAFERCTKAILWDTLVAIARRETDSDDDAHVLAWIRFNLEPSARRHRARLEDPCND